jgi:hypothetical protein
MDSVEMGDWGNIPELRLNRGSNQHGLLFANSSRYVRPGEENQPIAFWKASRERGLCRISAPGANEFQFIGIEHIVWTDRCWRLWDICERYRFLLKLQQTTDGRMLLTARPVTLGSAEASKPGCFHVVTGPEEHKEQLACPAHKIFGSRHVLPSHRDYDPRSCYNGSRWKTAT